jgi:hypothetical protein
MSTPKDGGPAFPSDFTDLEGSGFSKGMTLRDYFAAAALQGLYAATADPNCSGLPPMKAAEGAYRIADAMLEVRRQK